MWYIVEVLCVILCAQLGKHHWSSFIPLCNPSWNLSRLNFATVLSSCRIPVTQYLPLFEEENNAFIWPNAVTATADARNPAAYLTIISWWKKGNSRSQLRSSARISSSFDILSLSLSNDLKLRQNLICSDVSYIVLQMKEKLLNLFCSPITLAGTLPWNKYVDCCFYYFVDNDCWFYLSAQDKDDVIK